MIDRYSLSPMKDLWNEEAKFASWLEVELAVCDVWNKMGKIPDADLKRIHSRAKIDVARIEEIENTVHHDVIAFTTQLAEKIGPSSRFVHLGLTSSDVVDTAFALRLKRAGEIIQRDLNTVKKELTKLAKKHAHTIMMGRTHGMHAEPTTFGLKALVWRQEFERQKVRFDAACQSIAFGKISGAVGTAAHTGLKLEERVCKKLKLSVAPVSTQVLQRDRHAEFALALAQIGASIEKIATEIRHLQRPEIRELEEPFRKGQKGSSAMPHKRNPIICERLTGLARMLRGYAMPALENVALWSERDISHSSVERINLPDACMLTDYMLNKLIGVLSGLRVNKQRMKDNIGLTRGLVFSQRVLLRLVEEGLSREDSYAAVQAAAMRTWNGGDAFLDELLKEDVVAAKIGRETLENAFDVSPYLAHVTAIYKRCGISLK
ncbi:adenylosuccinate lyase [bacterium]|nr:adenylosuccinate lyase [bacterium]